MPLEGYLGTLDPGRISSVCTVPGDKTRRKKIKPNTRGTEASTQLSMYVRDCETHEPRGAVVPVELFNYDQGVGWKSVGVAKCCPLCWRILVAPEGVELPDPQPNPPVGRRPNSAQREGLKIGRLKRQKKPVQQVTPAISEAIEAYIMDGAPFSVQDVMSTSGKARTPVRKALVAAVKSGKLKIVVEGGHGLASKTLYEAP